MGDKGVDVEMTNKPSTPHTHTQKAAGKPEPKVVGLSNLNAPCIMVEHSSVSTVMAPSLAYSVPTSPNVGDTAISEDPNVPGPSIGHKKSKGKVIVDLKGLSSMDECKKIFSQV